MSDQITTVTTGGDAAGSALDITPMAQVAALVAQPMPDAREVSMAEIDIHTHTSSRLSPNHSAQKFVDLLRDGKQLPAIVLFFDQSTGRHYVGDGWERVEAALDLQAEKVGAHVLPGTAELAFLYHVWKNTEHGMPLSDMEVHHAIEHLLCNYPYETDLAIADICHATRGMVQRLRGKLIEEGKIERSSTRRDRKGREFTVPPRTQIVGQQTAAGVIEASVSTEASTQSADPVSYIQVHASTRLLKLYQMQWVSLDAIYAIVRVLESGVVDVEGNQAPLNPRVKAAVEKHGLADVQLIPVLQRLAEANPPDERFLVIERTGSMPGQNGGTLPLFKCTPADFRETPPVVTPPPAPTHSDAASAAPLPAGPSKVASRPAPAPTHDEPEPEEVGPAGASIEVEDTPAVRTFSGDVLNCLEANSVGLILNLSCPDVIDWVRLGQQADEVLKPGGFLAVEVQQNQLSGVLPVLDQCLTFWRLVMARGESRKVPGRCQLMACVRMVAVYARPDNEGNLIPNPDWLTEWFDAASDEEIAAKLINALTIPGETVADPFGFVDGGVQTTSVRWGRPWVGLAADGDQ